MEPARRLEWTESVSVHGLTAEGRSFSNWGGHRTTTPGVYVEPISYADVQAVARDQARFPTSVNLVGSMLFVTDAFTNDGGTLICLRKLEDILGVETDASAQCCARAGRMPLEEAQYVAKGTWARNPVSSRDWRSERRLGFGRRHEGILAQCAGLFLSPCCRNNLCRRDRCAARDFGPRRWRPGKDEKRLDFQYYEHDLPQLKSVLVESYAFTKGFEAESGFAPAGWTTYFVNRPPKAQKPFGLFSDGPGVSFSFDPFFSDLCEPRWQQFWRRYNRFAIEHLRARVLPIQTQWLQKGDVMIPKRLARPRFTTPYFAEFLE